MVSRKASATVIPRPRSKSCLPPMVRIRQRLDSRRVEDLSAAVREEMEKCGLHSDLVRGSRVAITAGSRGIAQIDEVLRQVVSHVKEAGGKPFLIPAMGSHGGATTEGQKEILESLGITESTMNAPIRATMEVEQVGSTAEGLPVYVDKIALAADGIIVVNRIKQHTDFSGPIESGLSKIMAVGMGKQRGAETIHNLGLPGLRDAMPQVAQLILDRTRILMGLAVLENGYHEVAGVVGVAPESFQQQETQLLKSVRRRAPSLPVSPLDVLVIDRIGKNLSGTGIDTKVIGRLREPPHAELRHPVIRIVVSLDLTEASHGNGVGVGLTEFTTRKLADKIDWEVTRTNVVTAGAFERAKLPFVLDTEREAVVAAVEAARVSPAEGLRLVRIRDTLSLGEMEISSALLPEVSQNPRIEVLGPARPWEETLDT